VYYTGSHNFRNSDSCRGFLGRDVMCCHVTARRHNPDDLDLYFQCRVNITVSQTVVCSRNDLWQAKSPTEPGRFQFYLAARRNRLYMFHNRYLALPLVINPESESIFCRVTVREVTHSLQSNFIHNKDSDTFQTCFHAFSGILLLGSNLYCYSGF
jgi:hypothetical protein